MHIDEDHHVHANMRDGSCTPRESLRLAESRGLRALTLVERMGERTGWIPTFCQTLRQLRRASSLNLRGGLEAQLTHFSGRCDVPQEFSNSELARLYIANDRFVMGAHAIDPHTAKQYINEGDFTLEEGVDMLVHALLAAMKRYPGSVLARPFSLLPKLGASEAQHISDEHLRALARRARETHCSIEVDEQWRCPSLRTTLFFVEQGVEVLASSNAHQPQDIATYDHVRNVYEGIGGQRPPRPSLRVTKANAPVAAQSLETFTKPKRPSYFRV